MIEKAFRSILGSLEYVDRHCGNRIHPLVLPTDSPMPAIHFAFVGGNSQPAQGTHGSQRYRVEVNCWGRTYDDAVSLRLGVILGLDQYDTGGIYIQFLQPQDFFDDELRQYRAMAEFYVYFNLSVFNLQEPNS